jgi:hypothetical protein
MPVEGKITVEQKKQEQCYLYIAKSLKRLLRNFSLCNRIEEALDAQVQDTYLLAKEGLHLLQFDRFVPQTLEHIQETAKPRDCCR